MVDQGSKGKLTNMKRIVNSVRKTGQGKEMHMSDLLEVTDQTFDTEIINSDIPAMVDFWAAWCGPCRMVGPVVEELAKQYEGKIKVAKMDVDQNRQTPARFGIRNIPTLILFKGGEVAQTIVGAHPKSHIEEELKKLL